MRDSDVTLDIALPSADGVAVSPGTALTLALAEKYSKPSMVIRDGGPDESAKVLTWLEDQGREMTVNGAGPWESESHGVYRLAFHVIFGTPLNTPVRNVG